MKPSERIIEIHKALKVLDGQNPDDKNFNNTSFFEQAIIQYLDELAEGTNVERRTKN